MPYCPNCGGQVKAESKFCPYCGARRAVDQRTMNVEVPRQEGGAGAYKIRISAVEPVKEQAPPESPEERRKRIGSTSPVLHQPKGWDKELGSMVWMLRIGLVVILLITASNVEAFSNPADTDFYFLLITLALFLGGGECLNYISKLRLKEARFTPEGIILSPISLYPLIKIKGSTIPKEEITKVEIVRTRDASPNQLRTLPQGGVPTSLAIYRMDGKIIALARREAAEILAASEYAEVIWGTAKADPATKGVLAPEEVYREFPNDHGDSNKFISWIFIAFIGVFIGMGAWMILPDFRPINIIIALIPLGMSIFMIWALRRLHDRSHGVRSVLIDRTGFELHFKGRTEFIPWSGLKILVMARPDGVRSEKEKIANIQLDRKRIYTVSMKIGEALSQAYRENTGNDAPNEWTMVDKKSGYSANDLNALKYENPALFKKNQFIAVALFANGLMLMINIAIDNRLILFLGILLLIALLFARIQTAKEIKEFMVRRTSKGP